MYFNVETINVRLFNELKNSRLELNPKKNQN